jgi:carotenoid cleavage dioxygenase
VNKSVDIPVDGMPMIHDMSITERYIVIYDLPVTVKLSMLVTRSGFPFAWDDDHGARVGLLPRDGTAEDVIWIDVSPGYVYHPMNAYDDAEGNVVIDVCRYARMFDKDIYGPFGDNVPTLDRWTLNPSTRRASETRIDDRGQEFPRCHPGHLGKPYRYGYTAGVDGLDFSNIYKHDLTSGVTESIAMGAGRHTGEPYFVPREGAVAEDDGFLMSFVYDASENTSELVVFDAQDLTAPALARVHLPARVPFGFHGSWIPDEGVGV